MRRLAILAAGLAGCGGPSSAAGPAAQAPVVPTDRIPIPPAVVQNLGITFGEATRGRLERTLAVPGRLEVPPEARWSIRAPAAGRVTLRAHRWQAVAAGAPVAALGSAELRAAQDQLTAARGAILEAGLAAKRLAAEAPAHRSLASARRTAAEAARARVAATEALLERARELEAACGQRVEAVRRLAIESTVAAKQLHDAEQERFEACQAVLDTDARAAAARVEASQAELDAAAAEAKAEGLDDELAIQAGRRTSAELAFRRHLDALAALTGLAPDALATEDDDGPAWLRLSELVLRAPAEGVVVALAVGDGAWVDAGEVLAEVEDARTLVFRGWCPEGDLARIPADAVAQVEVAGGGQAPRGRLVWPPREVDPAARTVLLEARIANPDRRWPDGVSATARVVLARSEVEETLVPLDCVTQDGLTTLVFRVDPQNAGQVIRTPVTLGHRNRTHAEALAGVGPGDRLVRSGLHQLRQAASAASLAGGHFHADGTWHAGPAH